MNLRPSREGMVIYEVRRSIRGLSLYLDLRSKQFISYLYANQYFITLKRVPLSYLLDIFLIYTINILLCMLLCEFYSTLDLTTWLDWQQYDLFLLNFAS